MATRSLSAFRRPVDTLRPRGGRDGKYGGTTPGLDGGGSGILPQHDETLPLLEVDGGSRVSRTPGRVVAELPSNRFAREAVVKVHELEQIRSLGSNDQGTHERCDHHTPADGEGRHIEFILSPVAFVPGCACRFEVRRRH